MYVFQITVQQGTSITSKKLQVVNMYSILRIEQVKDVWSIFQENCCMVTKLKFGYTSLIYVQSCSADLFLCCAVFSIRYFLFHVMVGYKPAYMFHNFFFSNS